jgi:hypothetical protein
MLVAPRRGVATLSECTLRPPLLSRWPLFCGRFPGLANSLVRLRGLALHP